MKLGVNIDHVATLRQARGTTYPNPIAAALMAIDAGADSITLHLREDRRHIQDDDVLELKQILEAPMNLELAATEFMVTFAEKVKPAYCCVVPEKREELTTEGGLDVLSQEDWIATVCQRLSNAGIQVSLFIDPDSEQVDAAKRCGAPVIELHTGAYAEADGDAQQQELERIQQAAQYAAANGLIVNAGHGLHYHNVQAIAQIPEIHELNIGHSIVSQAVFDGFSKAVADMKAAIDIS